MARKKEFLVAIRASSDGCIQSRCATLGIATSLAGVAMTAPGVSMVRVSEILRGDAEIGKTVWEWEKKAEPQMLLEPPAQRTPSQCFRCGGSGEICDACGESPAACVCDEDKFDGASPCPDCKGTGK